MGAAHQSGLHQAVVVVQDGARPKPS